MLGLCYTSLSLATKHARVFLLPAIRVVRVIFCRPNVIHTVAIYSIPQRFVGRDFLLSESCHPCDKIHTESRRFVDPCEEVSHG